MTIHPSTIIVTGAAGFIGSCMAAYIHGYLSQVYYFLQYIERKIGIKPGYQPLA
jgi:nucleoside-diphosphate-sugar epimerase